MTMSGWATPAYKQPWTYGEPYTAINRKYLKLRERLLPYFYSYAAEAHRTGAPLNRSLCWSTRPTRTPGATRPSTSSWPARSSVRTS
jgi:alpha-glucosidase (family GH31 glycosyl hydrolase)